MAITSLAFLAFTLIVLLLYYILPRRTQNYLLLIASYVFLTSWNIQFAFIFFVLTGLTYGLALAVVQKGNQGKSALYAGILLNLVALALFKYGNFFIAQALTALSKLGVHAEIGALNILLPVGLSIFVVQNISFLLDVRRGIVQVPRPVDYALYMVYFPRILAGPIERARHFFPILQKERTLNGEQIGQSVALIMQGMVRKMIIADLLFLISPKDVFTNPQGYSAIELALWLLTYSFALYNDFAGYTALARGVSGLFGIPLSSNFNAPYFSRSFSEFWRRWHITLSDWLRDYIFTPMTRFLLKRKLSQTHLFSIVIPPMITMAVSALWHGIGWGMFLWGSIHGVALIVERIINLRRPAKLLQTQPVARQIVSITLVFLITTLAWVPFHTDLSSALQYWAGLLSPSHWIDAVKNFAVIHTRLWNIYIYDFLFLVGLSILLDLVQLRFGELALLKRSSVFQGLAIAVVIVMVVIAVLAQNTPPPFVYQWF